MDFFNRHYRLLAVLVFGLGAILRIGLALVNTEANDDHMEVIQIIRQENRLPLKEECWECFQPKLFHATGAFILNLLHIPAGLTSIKVIQLFNALLGCATIFIIWRFINLQPLGSNSLKLFAFALTCLNPKLIGINAQATNDTLAIFLGTVSLYYACCYCQSRLLKHLGLSSAATVLATLTKTNGVVLFISILVTLELQVFGYSKDRLTRNVWLPVLAFAILVPLATIILPIGQYIENYQRFGTPTTLNIERQPFPNLFEKTYEHWPGITSIADGFFTFRLDDLLRYPRNNASDTDYPLHRTSFWSQLYGQAHSVHFDGFPLTWATDDPAILNLSRAILILALLPTGLLLTGLATETWRGLRACLKRDFSYFSSHSGWMLTLAFLGFLVFVVAYALFYRNYVVMKAIFLFPALLAMPYHFMIGTETLAVEGQPYAAKLRPVVYILLTALLVCYSLDVVTLIMQLGFFH